MSSSSTAQLKLLLIDADRVTGHIDSGKNAVAENTPANLGTQFLTTASQCASQTAVTTRQSTQTYNDLQQVATSIAEQLHRQEEFTNNTAVILVAPNSFEYIAGFYGITLAGGVVVPLPPSIEQKSLARIIESTNATVMLSTRTTSRRLLSQHPGIVEQPWSTHSDNSQNCSHLEGLSKEPDDLAALFFTAGSTGTPKGVMLSHRNLISNAQSIREYLSIKPDDRPLCVLPFFHAFGNSVLQSHILTGAELIIDGSTVFPESLIESINHHQATSLSGVPDLFRVLLERTSLGTTPTPSLRYMAVAGGALQRELALQVNDRIHSANFVVMYGQTEATARLGYLPPDELPNAQPGCIGKAIPGVSLRVVDDKGQTAPVGEVGELVAQGPNIMLGYWKSADATRERIKDGWLYTGDLASIDEHGWICHKGRKNSIVKIAGYRVHPGDLEEFAVRKLPVRHAVAVPFEMQGLGTRMALYVINEKGAANVDTKELQATCRAELPRHLVPEIIQPIDEFPLNDAMKVDRPALKKQSEEYTTRRGKISA